MHTANNRRSLLPAGLWLVGLLALSLGVASAADWPTFKPGQWRFDRTIEGMGPSPRKVSSTKCVDPTADFARQREQLTRAGCKYSALTQNGNSYSYSATCRMAGTSSTSNSLLKFESAEAYSITVDSDTDGAKTHEALTARRLGDCGK